MDDIDFMLIGKVIENVENGMDGKEAVDAVLGPYRPIPFVTVSKDDEAQREGVDGA